MGKFSGELLEAGGSIISDIGTPGYPEKEREQTKMLHWAQSKMFNWATAEYSIIIKLKGSPYYHEHYGLNDSNFYQIGLEI